MSGTGPAPRRDEQAVAPATSDIVTNLLPTAKAVLPMVSNDTLTTVLTAVMQGERSRFDARLRAAAPSVDTEALWNTMTGWFHWGERVDDVAGRHADARLSGNQAEAEQTGREARDVAAEGRRLGISDSDQIMLGEMRTQIQTQGRAQGRSAEQIRTMEEDLARAAIGYGFSMGAVVGTFGDLATQSSGGRSGMGRTKRDMFRQVMGEAAARRTEELMRRMREKQDEMGGLEGARRKRAQQDYDEMLAEFGRLTGHSLAETVADRWIRGGEAPQAEREGRQVTLSAQDMRAAAIEETEHIFDLHTHNLGNVVASKTEMRTA